MSQEDFVTIGKALVEKLAALLRELDDDEVAQLLGTGAADELLEGLLDPKTASDAATLGDFFLANKNRLTILALIRHAVTWNYSFAKKRQEKTYYASPTHFQWFDDGFLYLEGQKPFEGQICLFRDGAVSVAFAGRDAREGDPIGPEDLEFVDLDEANARLAAISSQALRHPTAPIESLLALLESGNNEEAAYQTLLEEHPWILGLKYRRIQRHETLDDANIPDFTGVRVHDDARDIIEIKPPFAPLFRADGEFRAGFHEAWSQAERYLTFAREEKDYLMRQKGLFFDNPKCYLVIGYNLSSDQLVRIRTKEKLTPAIEVLTYNDLLAYMKNTADFMSRREASGEDVE